MNKEIEQDFRKIEKELFNHPYWDELQKELESEEFLKKFEKLEEKKVCA